jgi:lysophospholipase L1-like esterase
MILATLAASALLIDNLAPPPCAEALCGGAYLRPYFDALQARGAIDGAPPVHILQIGDSHSAGDAISGAWRDILQARYGAGGRGVLPPGDPYYGFLPHGVHVSQSGAWRVEATFGKTAPPAGEPVVFGVTGYRLSTDQAGATIALAAEPIAAFNRVVVCGVTGPGQGGYAVTLGGASIPVSMAGAPGVDCETFGAPGLETQVSLTAQGGQVTLLSWGVFRPGGVVVSNMGVVGAQLRHFARTDDGALAQELHAYQPDLIVLEFGTNEGFVGRFDAREYELGLRAQIRRLKRLSAATPILLLGAPDAGTDRRELAHNAEPASGGAYPVESSSGGWFPPPALARIRDVQRRVAADEGVAFWDWAARMGGPGAAQSWAAASPPLMRRDHVHFTTEGGVEVARRLQADLDSAAAATAPP